MSGSVRQPLSLSAADLSRMGRVQARLNEVARDGRFTGVFTYRGVPLRDLIELASPGKEEGDFTKLIDLAVVVRGAGGHRAVLSWGEVMYRDPGDAIIALAAEPVMPMKQCSDCHKSASEYRKYAEPLSRAVLLPRLVLPGDFYADRCVEGVTGIEVVDLRPPLKTDRTKKPHSPSFEITLPGKPAVKISSLGPAGRTEVSAKQVGDGKGFHGTKRYEGVPLAGLLAASKLEPGLDGVFLVSAPDGYRSAVSAGELLLGEAGRSIIVADREGGSPLRDPGRFAVIMPRDLSADRWVKAVDRIRFIPLGGGPSLSIVGVGCGDTRLVTLEALSAMARADAFVCTDDIKSRFAKYMGGKPVLYDPLLNLAHYYRKMNPGVGEAEAKKKVEELRAANIRSIKDALKAGKSVAFLEYGDPTIYGSWTYWLYEHFGRDEVKVVPGVSAFNAANAMIGKNVAARGSVVITVPNGLRDNEKMLEAVARGGDTVAIFIGLTELGGLMPLLKKYYPAATPAAVAYRAGYEGSQSRGPDHGGWPAGGRGAEQREVFRAHLHRPGTQIGRGHGVEWTIFPDSPKS